MSKFTRKRTMVISKELLEKRRSLQVHKGKSFRLVEFHQKMIGHKVGEFSPTKNLGARIHDSVRNNKRKKKKQK